MKILQICHKPPFPPVDGGCIAMNNISQGLINRGIKLKILTLNTFKHPLNVDALPEDYKINTQIETVFVDTTVRLSRAILNLFGRDSYNIVRFFSSDFEHKISETLNKERFDIIHLESLFVLPYLEVIRKNSDAKIVYRAHNIEFEIWEELALAEKNIFKKWYLHFLSERLKKFEIQKIMEVDAMAAISEIDLKKVQSFGIRVPARYIPFGIYINEYTPAKKNDIVSNLFFLGSMDWLPNREGIIWFLEKVWKNIYLKSPGLKLVIAGKGLDSVEFFKKIPNVEIAGEVPDAKKFMVENGVMIVPLLSGSGVRVKIIEGLALGKIIVATKIAAKGIDCEHKKNILLANDESEFAEMINYALGQNCNSGKISDEARNCAIENYDNTVVTEKLISFYEGITG